MKKNDRRMHISLDEKLNTDLLYRWWCYSILQIYTRVKQDNKKFENKRESNIDF